MYNFTTQYTEEELNIRREYDEFKENILNQVQMFNSFLTHHNKTLSKFGIIPNVVIQQQGKVFQVTVSLDSGYYPKNTAFNCPPMGTWNNPLGAHEIPWVPPKSDSDLKSIYSCVYSRCAIDECVVIETRDENNNIHNKEVFKDLIWSTPNKVVPHISDSVELGKQIILNKESFVGRIQVLEQGYLCRFDRPVIGMNNAQGSLNLDKAPIPDDLDFVIMREFNHRLHALQEKYGKSLEPLRGRSFDPAFNTITVLINDDLYVLTPNKNLLRLCHQDKVTKDHCYKNATPIPNVNIEVGEECNLHHFEIRLDTYKNNPKLSEEIFETPVKDRQSNRPPMIHYTIFQIPWKFTDYVRADLSKHEQQQLSKYSTICMSPNTFLGSITVFKDSNLYSDLDDIIDFTSPTTSDAHQYLPALISSINAALVEQLDIDNSNNHIRVKDLGEDGRKTGTFYTIKINGGMYLVTSRACYKLDPYIDMMRW